MFLPKDLFITINNTWRIVTKKHFIGPIVFNDNCAPLLWHVTISGIVSMRRYHGNEETQEKGSGWVCGWWDDEEKGHSAIWLQQVSLLRGRVGVVALDRIHFLYWQFNLTPLSAAHICLLNLNLSLVNPISMNALSINSVSRIVLLIQLNSIDSMQWFHSATEINW